MVLDPVTALLSVGNNLINKFFPDPEQRDKAQMEFIKMQQAGEFKELEAQIAQSKSINETMQAEYAANSKFKTSWRPLFGYILAISFAGMMGSLIYSLVYSVLYEPEAIQSILSAISTLFTAGLTVMGVNIWQRSKDKKLLSGIDDKSIIDIIKSKVTK